jgi:shikimate 5-dehydrogenase
VRTGQLREGEALPKGKKFLPKTLIWAAPPTAALPPGDWKPEQIIDLNYREDSLAKEYGQKTGAIYISGLPMFKAQARAQQEFWEARNWEGKHDRK